MSMGDDFAGLIERRAAISMLPSKYQTCLNVEGGVAHPLYT
jgi:hypothetical protein